MAYKATSDRILFVTTSLLTLFGLVMVYSASSVVAASQHGMSSYYFCVNWPTPEWATCCS